LDDHAAVRHEVALMLAEEGVGDCREAAGREEALEAAGRERPDVALVDLSPGTEDALQLVAELCARNIPVLVYSMHEEPSYVRRALAAGAHGYITKREAPRQLARAVRDVLDGWMLISPCAAEGLGVVQPAPRPDGASSPNVRPNKGSGECT
jgi:DNA-binding NarL/FixJ family response regulator